jgi:RNA polymerase sigma-70 factor (ECF subfamily)
LSNDDPLEARAIERAQNGDPEAYDVLVSAYFRRVVSIAFGIVRNGHDAEDLAQEAFVRAWQNLGRFRAGEPFGPWISRIVTNLSLDVVRRRGRFRHEEIAASEPATRRDDPSLSTSTNEIAARIDAAIQDLPEMQQLVARLHLVEGLEHAQIANITGLSEGTVRSHLSHARTKLKTRLADLYD